MRASFGAKPFQSERRRVDPGLLAVDAGPGGLLDQPGWEADILAMIPEETEDRRPLVRTPVVPLPVPLHCRRQTLQPISLGRIGAQRVGKGGDGGHLVGPVSAPAGGSIVCSSHPRIDSTDASTAARRAWAAAASRSQREAGGCRAGEWEILMGGEYAPLELSGNRTPRSFTPASPENPMLDALVIAPHPDDAGSAWGAPLR